MEDKEKRRLWEERVKMFLASGQNQRAWSREQGLPANQLGYWLRKFKSEAKEPDGTRWVSLQDTARPGSGVSLRIGDLVVEVENGFDKQLLAEVVHTLMTLC